MAIRVPIFFNIYIKYLKKINTDLMFNFHHKLQRMLVFQQV